MFVKRVGIKRFTKFRVVIVHAPERLKCCFRPEHNFEAFIRMLLSVFTCIRSKLIPHFRSAFFWEEVPCILVFEIIKNKIFFLILIQEIMAYRGYIHVIKGIESAVSVTCKKWRILQYQSFTAVIIGFYICSNQTAG